MRPIQNSATCSWVKFGGANGELAAAMQYSIQGLNCDDPERKDLLMDIGTRN
jgi:Mn-containing catalase